MKKVVLLGALYQTDQNIASTFQCGPQGLPVVTQRQVEGLNVIEMKHVDCLVAAVHTCYVAEPQCQIVDHCIDHIKTDCEECDPVTGWMYSLDHCESRKTYYILDSAHGYNPHFKH